jgi:Eukaryotic-type carbonic anhydrase
MEVKFDLTNSTNTTGFGFTVPGFGYLPATQLHFHSPSEHTINGLHYPLEMHIVNQLVTYNATTGAYKAGVPAGVITVMFGYTPDNTPSAFLDSIFTGLSTTKNLTFEQYVTMAATNQYIAKNNSVENEVTGGAALDLSGLLASSSPSSYYRYNGSLTTPACSQTVQFNILDAPLSVSYAQVVRFTNLLAAAQGGISRGADNRAPNPTTTKVVKSFSSVSANTFTSWAAPVLVPLTVSLSGYTVSTFNNAAQAAFIAATASTLQVYPSAISITNVVASLTRRRLLSGVSVSFTVATTIPASTLSTTLSSPAFTAALATSFAAASLTAPVPGPVAVAGSSPAASTSGMAALAAALAIALMA